MSADERMTILAVDDEAAVLRIVQRMLELSGFAVETAQGGHAALSAFLAEPHRFDCILLDLSMPDLPGDEVIRRIRAVDSQVPIVVTSGYPAAESAHVDAVGARTVFLQKPWRREDLVAAIKGLARKA